MSTGFNQFTCIGNLGNDPETKYSAAGVAITTISVGVSEQWKDKDGNKQERTEWVRVTFFNKLAEIAGEWLKKGQLVFIQGKMRTDKYTDNEGVEKYSTKIIADTMKMLGGKRDSGDGERAERSSSPRPRSEAAPQREAQGGAAKSHDLDDNFDDDIPFN